MVCSINCTGWKTGAPTRYQADPDIAGLGIVTAFIASSALALLLSLLQICLTPSQDPDDNYFDFWVSAFLTLCVKGAMKGPSAAAEFVRNQPSRKPTKGQELVVRVIEKVIVSLSDQLLLTGLAVLIAGFWTHCSISVYHFALSSDLAWFASNVHLTTLSVLQTYLRDRPILRNWRVFLMSCMAVFLLVSTIMQGHAAWYVSWPYNAQCVFDDFTLSSIGGHPGSAMSVNLFFLAGYIPSILVLFQWPPNFCKRWLYIKPQDAMQRTIEKANRARIVCVRTFAAVHSSVYSIIASSLHSRWLGLSFCTGFFVTGIYYLLQDRSISSSDTDGDENAMSFGQIVPILLLSSTVFVIREAYEDVKIEMSEHSLEANTSVDNLLHPQSTSTPASQAGQDFEMSGALQDLDENDNYELASPRRVDTEMGGRSQGSGVEATIQPIDPQRRSTFPRSSGNETP